MGHFDYPSPYWDSVGDPALDLIDRMLTVDVSKRISIDECLEHPWTRDLSLADLPSSLRQNFINPADSTDGLTGALGTLKMDFSKRKVKRERTLLANINDIKVSKVVELPKGTVPGTAGPQKSPTSVTVWEKNPQGKRQTASQKDGPVTNGTSNKKGAKGKGGKVAKKKEEQPAEHRQEEEFMQMGGKGDMQLFGDDASSRYLPEEVPKEVATK